MKLYPVKTRQSRPMQTPKPQTSIVWLLTFAQGILFLLGALALGMLVGMVCAL